MKIRKFYKYKVGIHTKLLRVGIPVQMYGILYGISGKVVLLAVLLHSALLELL